MEGKKLDLDLNLDLGQQPGEASAPPPSASKKAAPIIDVPLEMESLPVEVTRVAGSVSTSGPSSSPATKQEETQVNQVGSHAPTPVTTNPWQQTSWLKTASENLSSHDFHLGLPSEAPVSGQISLNTATLPTNPLFAKILNKRLLTYVIGGLLIAVAAAFLAFPDILEKMMSSDVPEIAPVDMALQAKLAAAQKAKEQKSREEAAALAAAAAAAKAQVSFDAQNPYWNLPNPSAPALAADAKNWSAAEQEIWKSQINHPFVYQQFKAVADVRFHKRRGAEEILRQGLQAKKFWTRINAAIGLAEFGETISEETLSQVFSNTRSETIANFLKRLRTKASPGALHVARESMRILDQRGRSVLVSVFAAHPEPVNLLYLVAAQMEPMKAVRSRADIAIAKIIPDSDLVLYQRMVRGEEATDKLFASVVPAPQNSATTTENPAIVPAADMKQPEVKIFPAKDGEELNIEDLIKSKRDDGFDDLNVIEVKTESKL